jgi:cell shape-determining protein MreD
MNSLIFAFLLFATGILCPLLVKNRETDNWLIFVVRRFLPTAFFGVAFGIVVGWLIKRCS